MTQRRQARLLEVAIAQLPDLVGRLHAEGYEGAALWHISILRVGWVGVVCILPAACDEESRCRTPPPASAPGLQLLQLLHPCLKASTIDGMLVPEVDLCAPKTPQLRGLGLVLGLQDQLSDADTALPSGCQVVT